MISETTTNAEVIDPVCGMSVDPVTAAGSYNQDGTNYYFCSKACLQKFIASPEDKSSGCCSRS